MAVNWENPYILLSNRESSSELTLMPVDISLEPTLKHTCWKKLELFVRLRMKEHFTYFTSYLQDVMLTFAVSRHNINFYLCLSHLMTISLMATLSPLYQLNLFFKKNSYWRTQKTTLF